jgi:transposase
MLRMDKVHVIRHKVLVEGRSEREVARELGISRNTVSKYLEVSEPRRVETAVRPKPVLERVRGRIDALLEEWGPRTTRKQRITATRILRQLREEGFEVGITTVKTYLRDKRIASAEVFIPLLHVAGDSMQVDFFEVTVEEGGIVRKVWKFLARLMHSGYDFVWLYERCDQLSFLDGHKRAFEFYEGVPARGWYDNLKPAVRKRVGIEVELSDRFAALASHYLFEPCFARPAQGHDKGGVESRGKHIRYQHLTPVPAGASLSAIAQWVLEDVKASARERKGEDGRTVFERFEAERSTLRPLPSEPFEVRRFQSASVSSKATVQVAGALYSVPSTWARLEATAYVGVEDIRLICRGEVRLVPRVRPGQRLVRYRDYLPELQRKPQAVRQVAVQLIEELGGPWVVLWQVLVATHGEREAARVLSRLLGAVVKHGEQKITESLDRALVGEGVNLLALSEWLHEAEEVETVQVPAMLTAYEIEATSALDYDWLLEGGVQ